MKRLALVVAGLGALLLVLAGAMPASAGAITIQEPWVRASLGNVPSSAAYMTIRSGAPDRLTGVATAAAERAMLHESVMDGGVMRMRAVDALEVTPAAPAKLAPGGLHVMLTGLTGRLEEGASVTLELTFEQAGKVTVEAPVRGLRAGSAGHGAHHDQGAGSMQHGAGDESDRGG